MKTTWFAVPVLPLLVLLVALPCAAQQHGLYYADQFQSGSTTGGIQEAENACPSSGCALWVPCAGTTEVSSTIAISKPTEIHGCGRTASLITGTQTLTGPIFAVTQKQVSFVDLTITRRLAPADSAAVGIEIVGSANQNSPVNDIHVSNLVVSKHYYGIASRGSCNYVYIEDSVIAANVSDGAHLGCGGFHQRHNHFYGNGGNGETIINAGGWSEGNEFFANKGRGYDFTGDGTGSDYHSDDVFDSNGGEGLFVQRAGVFGCTNCRSASSGVSFDGDSPNWFGSYANKPGAVFDNSNQIVSLTSFYAINNGGSGLYFPGTRAVFVANSFVAGNNQSGVGVAGITIADNGPSVSWGHISLSGLRVWDQFGNVHHQQIGLSVSGGAGGFLEITGGDYTGNSSSAMVDTSTAAKKIVAAAGLTDLNAKARLNLTIWSDTDGERI